MWIDEQIVKRCRQPIAVEIFYPQHPVVVLGRSNRPDLECNRQSSINILRRSGGGGTVVLYPGSLVISLGIWVKHPYQNSHYFELINQSVIDCLAQRWPVLSQLRLDGISDICYGDRKVAGTSMFRSRNYLLYQASLIYQCDFELIETALAHPSKEPDYRQRRSHRQFLIGLQDIEANIESASLRAHMLGHFETTLRHNLGDECIDAIDKQVEYLLKRNWNPS